MNILILTSNNPYKNAGIVGLDLFNGLKKLNGYNLKMLVREWGNYPDKNIIAVDSFFKYFKKKVINKTLNTLTGKNEFARRSFTSDPNYCFDYYDQTETFYKSDKLLNISGLKPDVIIILFTQFFLNYNNLYELNTITGAPVVLIMLDMAPLTGGCHYAWDCKGYTEECGKCPGLFSEDSDDQSHKNLEFKKHFIYKTNVFPIACSQGQWIELNNSSLFADKSKEKILLPTNANLFCPMDKLASRNILNIPLDKKVIFYGAVNTQELRKGYKESVKAMNLLYSMLSEEMRNNVLITIAGRSDVTLENDFPFPTKYLEYLTHNELAIAYASADVFLSSSLQDSGPTMVNQAIMCGTPVVAFEIGIALDLVITAETGYRAKLKDCKDLAIGMKYILELDEQEYKKMSRDCRTLGMELCHPQKQIEKFVDVFKNII